LELKREKIFISKSWNEKLLNDSLVQLEILYDHFKSMPKYTREQFEDAERNHFEQKLGRQALGIDGAKMSIINMNEDFRALTKFKDDVYKLGNSLTSDALKMLRLNGENMLKG
jgi:hypothetical protein